MEQKYLKTCAFAESKPKKPERPVRDRFPESKWRFRLSVVEKQVNSKLSLPKLLLTVPDYGGIRLGKWQA